MPAKRITFAVKKYLDKLFHDEVNALRDVANNHADLLDALGPGGNGYSDQQAAAAAAAALVAGNSQHKGIQASVNNSQVVLTVAPQREDLSFVFPLNTISTGELPIVYSKWTGSFVGLAITNLTDAPEIKVNGTAVTAWPLALALGDIVRVTATVGGAGQGIVSILHA